MTEATLERRGMANVRPKLGEPCPCGSGRPFEQCCEPVLLGKRSPATAEELMRARFTAHVIHDFKFLHESYLPTSGKPFVAEEGEPTM
jgi:SEC-C motif-containing protein